MGDIVELKNKKGALTEKIYHPLMNVVPPSVEDLKKRCDDESIALLDAACRLASYRSQCKKQVRVAYDNYAAEPAAAADCKVIENEELFLTEMDLVRAFLACQAPFLEQNLFLNVVYGTRAEFPVSEKFKKSAAHWEHILKTYQPESLPRAITLRWGRRWALLILQKSDLIIDIHILLSSVFDHVPLDWSEFFYKGLITKKEALDKISRTYANQASYEFGLYDFPAVPPAFYDRHGLITKANDILRNSPGFFVIGENGTLRRDFIRALTAYMNYNPVLSSLEKLQGEGGEYLLSRDRTKVSSGKPSKPKVYTYLGNIPQDVGGPAWFFDGEDNILGPIAEVAIDFFKQIVALNKGDHVHFIIAMTPVELQELSDFIPQARSVLVLEVPAAEEKDLIPYFLSSLPAVMDTTNCSIPLGLLLDFLYQMSEINPGFLAVENVDTLHSYVNPNKEDLGLMMPASFETEKNRPFAFLSAIRKAYRSRKLGIMINDSGIFFKTCIGRLEWLEKLVHMYEINTRLNDKHLTEIDFTKHDNVKELLYRYAPEKKSTIYSAVGRSFNVVSAKGKKVRLNRLSQVSDDYVRTVKYLPRPTLVQTAAFAAFVADAHSWYKHLPLYPKTAVYFFLDPTVGMKPKRDGSGNVRYVEEKNPDGIHYTHMTTKKYREKFGHWKYHMDREAKLLDPMSLLSKASAADLDTKIQGIRGGSLIIPPRLFNTGKALVSAFVHENSPIHIWMDCKPRLLKQKNDEFLTILNGAPDELSDSLQFIWAVLNTDGWYPRDVNLLTDKKCYSELFSKENVPYRCWNDQAFLIKKAEELGGIGHYPQVILAAEYLRTHESREEAVLTEQEYSARRKLHLQLLSEKDREALLKKWQNTLANDKIDMSLDVLLKDWNRLESTKVFLANEFHDLTHNDKKIIGNLVKENLAWRVKDLATDKTQQKEAHTIWYNLFYKDENFSSFADKYYRPGAETRNLINRLTKERMQQIEGMIESMNNSSDSCNSLC